MTIAKERSQSRSSKWGWGILIVVTALLSLNGLVYYFVSGSSTVFEQDTGVSLAEFRQAYPTVADQIAQAGQTSSILLAGLGLLALIVALEGFRRGSRWAWNATWVLVGVLAGIGIHLLVGGDPAIGLLYLGVSAAALVALLLAGREPAPGG